MPKISVHGGPSNERAEPGDPGYVEPPADDAPADEPAADEQVVKATRKRTRKAKEQPGDVVAEMTVVAEAEVTRP